MKGLGSKIPVTNWTKTDDGKYAILDLPIFSLVDDTLKGIKFTLDKAMQAINIFSEDAKRGYFPRVFYGHHDGSATERKGLGFLDSLRLRGEDIIANIVDISEENFTLFKNNVVPYRSVEYNEGRNLITGLAVLESHSPFFRFSNINLSPTPILNFSLDTNINRRHNMPEDVKPETVVSQEPQAKPQDEKPKEECPAWAMEIKTLLAQLIQMEIDEKKEKEASKGIESAAQVGKQPGSVAMQLDPITNQMAAMQKELNALRNEKKYGDKLQSFCDENGLDFGTHKEIISKFSNDIDKDAYMTMLASHTFATAPHRMTGIANGFKNIPQDEANKLVQKHPGMQKVVREAIKTYNETMQHPDQSVVKMFSASFKDVSSFVDNVVEGTKSDPDYLMKMTLSE